jgi:argininosuccinate lyase/amino-acid N-acetyltransferase
MSVDDNGATPQSAARSAVWRGRIGAELDPRARALNDSLAIDRRLWPEELVLSRAWAGALVESGVLDAEGCEALRAACDMLESDLRSGKVELAGEDVHTAVEAELAKRCGEPALRLHTGRSRNDQAVTLLRMRVMSLCDEAVEWIRDLERALLAQARAAGDQAVAAQTHMQPAQPVLLAHLWLAHVAALERDETRFLAARESADLMVLGSGAVAGSPIRCDRLDLAGGLGFSRLADNSVDAVGDRDFALDYLNAAATLGVHLSRLAEELVAWCSPAYGWYALADGWSTGSSLLPQKRNPDLFELTRAKCARLVANAQRLAIVLKGLPPAYQKDLQEDKEAVFDSADTLAALLGALSPAIQSLNPRRAAMEASLTNDLLAIELADSLVGEGVPFREAHALVGRLWAEAEAAQVAVTALDERQLQAVSPYFTPDRLARLNVASALARRDHAPGTGPTAVAGQLARAEARLGLGSGDPEADLPPRLARMAHAAGLSQVAEPAPVPAVAPASADPQCEHRFPGGIVMRRARPGDVPGIARVMADYVARGTLLPRPVGELYMSVREFHVAVQGDEVVACAALRLLWEDMGEVRSLAVLPEHQGKGLGVELTKAVLADARALGLPRVIALTRELPFFERCGFVPIARDNLPRKVWTDCVRCPRRHACDEVAVVRDLVPGATAAAEAAAPSFYMPIPPPAEAGALPILP